MLLFNSVLCGSSEALIFGLYWHDDAIVPNNMLPFEDGETTGDVALLEDNIVVEESGVLDGPGCGLGNDVPKYNVKCRMIQYNNMYVTTNSYVKCIGTH